MVFLESTYFHNNNFVSFNLLLGFAKGNMLKGKDSKTVLPNNEQSQRKMTLRRYCSSVPPNTLTKMTLKNSIYSMTHQVVYCPIPKVATTNWKRIFQILEGHATYPMEIINGAKVHQLNYSTFKNINQYEQNILMNRFYTFLFVRHPFERLLSAYKDKFANPDNNYYPKEIGSKILKKFRNNTDNTDYSSGNGVTFVEFIKYVIYEFEIQKAVDNHWNTIHNLCQPCQVKYDYIGKFEALFVDSDNVFTEIGMDKTLTFPNQGANSKHPIKKSLLLFQMFSQLPLNTLTRLYQIYHADFNAFGYETLYNNP